MKKMIIVMFFACLFAGCSKETEEGFVIDIGLQMSVSDVDGNDLLDQTNPGSFKEDGIKLFHLKNGKAEEVNEKNLDNPKGYSVFQSEDGYRISMRLNDARSEEYPVTYIKWDESRTDTIKSEIHRTSNSIVITKVWLNDELKWEAYDSKRYIELLIP